MVIVEDVVDLFARKLLGSAGTGGMYSEALQGRLLNSGYHRRKIHISVKYFV